MAMLQTCLKSSNLQQHSTHTHTVLCTHTCISQPHANWNITYTQQFWLLHSQKRQWEKVFMKISCSFALLTVKNKTAAAATTAAQQQQLEERNHRSWVKKFCDGNRSWKTCAPSCSVSLCIPSFLLVYELCRLTTLIVWNATKMRSSFAAWWRRLPTATSATTFSFCQPFSKKKKPKQHLFFYT